MTIATLLPLGNYPTGSRSFGPAPIGDAITEINLRVQRCTSADPTIWPLLGTVLTLQAELLVNGQWVSYGSGTSNGGIALAKDGVTEVPFSLFGGFLPVASGRQIRGTVSITGGPLRTEVSVEVI